MAYTLTPEGGMVVVSPANGADFQFKELSRLVGGFIEIIPLSRGLIMVMNETGKLKNLPVNAEATEMAKEFIQPTDTINGTVVVCRREEVK